MFAGVMELYTVVYFFPDTRHLKTVLFTQQRRLYSVWRLRDFFYDHALYKFTLHVVLPNAHLWRMGVGRGNDGTAEQSDSSVIS